MELVEPTHMDHTLNLLSHKKKMDIFEAEIAQLPQLQVPVIHRFTEGLYIREVHVPAGTVFTSRTHKTQHPFVISKGACDIVDEKGNITRISAPHTGITEKGTRRVFAVYEDLVLTCFHPTELTDPDEFVELNTEMENDLLPKDFKQNCFEGRERLTWHR
jgi:hypothetical protein